MSDRFEWPGPDQFPCGAEAVDLGTRRTVRCLLAWNHKSEQHFWQEAVGDTLLSASWIGDGPGGLPTFIGKPAA